MFLLIQNNGLEIITAGHRREWTDEYECVLFVKLVNDYICFKLEMRYLSFRVFLSLIFFLFSISNSPLAID